MYNHLLYTFVTVAKAGSFAKAAELLFMSSVSVMKQMNALEEHLGIKLFERTGQGVFLTAAGQSIYDDATVMMNYSDSAIQKARKIAGIEEYKIRIGTSLLRPCSSLINKWKSSKSTAFPFQFEIIPFDDSPSAMKSLLDSLGRDIDCFVGPCDSKTWMKKYNVQLLGIYDCQLAVSDSHRLARKKKLTWKDLSGESIMLVKRGESVVLNNLRDDIIKNHPDISIIDIPNFYDTNVFNECIKQNCFMESLETWKDIHPSIITIPVDWKYKMPYGIIYAKYPSDSFKQFLKCAIDIL